MKTIVSLDYELFFGDDPGTVENSLIGPTEALAEVARRHNAKLVFFVDAGYLAKLTAGRSGNLAIDRDYTMVARQLEYLISEGHDLQLHVHPHWEDSRHDGRTWKMDLSRFRLQQFSDVEASELVGRYKDALAQFTEASEVIAYRAGGWALQPFQRIGAALKGNGIFIDSTIYPDGIDSSPLASYDFRGAPSKSWWRFADDPMREDKDGDFIEIPIATTEVAPSYYWKLMLMKKLKSSQLRHYGDGVGRSFPKKDLLKKAFFSSKYCATIDGYKSSLLHRAFAGAEKRGDEVFCIIGHPKTLTRYSLHVVEQMMSTWKAETATFLQLKELGFGTGAG